MTFASALNDYCEMLPCTASQIARKCSISVSAFSRYRSGQRTPDAHSDAARKLSHGIASLLRFYGVNSIATDNDVLLALTSDQAKENAAAQVFASRLDALMNTLHIRNADIADTTGLDASFISRIRHGQRKPHHITDFARKCAGCAASKALAHNLVDALCSLDRITVADVSQAVSAQDPLAALAALLMDWLTGINIIFAHVEDVIQAFTLIDSLDYPAVRAELLADPYWKTHCLSNRPAAASDHLSDSCFFYGLDAARKAELAFISEVLSRPETSTITLSSNMPYQALAADKDFLAHHRSGLMLFLERGGTINIIHNLIRPFAEVLMGLEYWAPLYLTGKVKTYFIKGSAASSMKSLVHISDRCALSAEELDDQPENLRYHLVTSPSEVDFCKRKAQSILDISEPLFTLYRMDNPEQRSAYEEERAKREAQVAGVEQRFADRYQGLRIVSYPDICSVIALTKNPRARAVVHHPRINEIIAHLDAFASKFNQAMAL